MNKLVFVTTLFLALSIFNSSKAQERLSSQTAFDYYLSLTEQNKKKFAIEYLYENKNDIYDKYWNDEFELNSRVESQTRELYDIANNFNFDETYYVVLSDKMGSYNFEEKAFDFQPIDPNTYIPVKKLPDRFDCTECKTFTKIRLNFNNGTAIKHAPVVKEKANQLIKDRKQNNGRVNRDIILKLYFKLDTKVKENKTSIDQTVDIFGNITKAEVIDSYGYNNQSGSHEVISTINIDEQNKGNSSSANTNKNNPEKEKVRSYINDSAIEQSLKNKLIEVINNHK